MYEAQNFLKEQFSVLVKKYYTFLFLFEKQYL